MLTKGGSLNAFDIGTLVWFESIKVLNHGYRTEIDIGYDISDIALRYVSADAGGGAGRSRHGRGGRQ